MKMASENGVPSQPDDDGGAAPLGNDDSVAVGTSTEHTPSSSSSSSPPSRKQSSSAKPDHTSSANHNEPRRLSNGLTENDGLLKESAESAITSILSDEEKSQVPEQRQMQRSRESSSTAVSSSPDQSPESKEKFTKTQQHPGSDLVVDTTSSITTTASSTANTSVAAIGTSTADLNEQSVTGSELTIVEDITGKLSEQTGSDERAPDAAVEPEERVIAASPDSRFLKYDIVIGRGSFKTVYKGLDTETGVAVAWCELQENRYNKQEQARFKEEVAILKTLQHPNILKLYDSWEVPLPRPGGPGDKKDRRNHVLVLVTELMTSGTLKGYMRRLKAIKMKVIRSWGRQILRGLHFLHTRSQPIIHRDLKCDNIFINGTTGLVKIGDLGLATLKRSDVKTVIGTPEFMAPEMYDEHYDESVDVYAFGMCLLEMSSGEYPYMECSNPAQIYKRVTQGIMPHALDKVRDPVLRDIINGCITLDKQRRYSVKDLLDHEFFAENVKFELLEEEESEGSAENHILTMRMEVPTKETPKTNKGQESIEFVYDLQKDDPAEVVKEMVKTGVLRNEDQKSAVRSLREYLDPIKQKKQQKDSTGEGAAKERDPAKTSQPVVPASTTASLAPSLSTITESTASTTQLDEEQQLGAPPKLQRMMSEEAPPTSSVVITATTTASSGVEGGDVGGAEEGGGAMKTQDAVMGGVWPNCSLEKGAPITSHAAPPQIDSSNQLIAKRSDAAPGTTPVHQVSQAPVEVMSGTHQNSSSASSLSNVPPASDHQASSSSLPEEERKTVRTNSNESEKSHQSQVGVAPPDEKQGGGITSEGVVPSQKDIVIQVSASSSSSSSGQTASSRSLVPVGPIEPGMNRSDESAAPANASTTMLLPSTTHLQSHELGVVQSAEHSTESTPTHFSQGSLESTSSTTIATQEQESKGERDKSCADKSMVEKGTNGTLKKKGPRGKLKQIKLNFVEMTDEKVVKCALVTGTGQMVNFQFSMKYDKPVVMFQKLVKAGHLASQHEEEFLKQIKNILSGTKKYTSAESASTVPVPAPSAAVGKDNKVPVHEPVAETKLSTPLEGKPLVETPPTSSPAPTSTSSAASTLSPVATTIAQQSLNVVAVSSSGVQQSSSRPSSQPPSPPSETVKMTFSDTVHSTSKAAISSAPISTEHGQQDVQTESGSIMTTGSASSAVVAKSTGGGLTYSQAVINGSTKTTPQPVSSIPSAVISQSTTVSVSTCSIAPAPLQSCPIVSPPSDQTELNELAPPTKRKKVFEVETVTEVDSPSPDHSEMSAHSSTENLHQTVKATDTDVTLFHHQLVQPNAESESGGSRAVALAMSHSASSLESKSDSCISVRHQPRAVVGGGGGSVGGGIMDFSVGSSSNTPEPVPPNNNAVGVMYHQPSSQVTHPLQPIMQSIFNREIVYGGQPHPPTAVSAHYQQDEMLKDRSISVGSGGQDMAWNPNYYHYNTAPHSRGVSSRQPLAGDTFYPPATHTYHGQYHSSHLQQVCAAPLIAHVSPPSQAEIDPQQNVAVMVPSASSHRHTEEQAFHYKAHQTRLSNERQRKSSPARALTIHDLPQAELLSQAFMQFMYSMSTVFRDPTYQPLIDSLDQQFGHHQKVEPHSAPPAMATKPVEQDQQEEEASMTRSNTQPVLTKHEAEKDTEYKSIMMKFEEEQRELEKRKQKAIEDYLRKREISSGPSSLESSGHLPTTRESSSDYSHDVIQSPSQSRRTPVVDLRNYQEASPSVNVIAHPSSSSSQEVSSAPLQKRDLTADLEKKVKSELLAEWDTAAGHSSQKSHDEQQQSYDLMMSTRNFTSPTGIRSPRHLPSVQDSNAKTVHVVQGSKVHPRASEGGPMSPPPLPAASSRSPVPQSPTIPAATFTLQTSPPPANKLVLWGSHSLPHHAQQQSLPQQQQQQQQQHQQGRHVTHQQQQQVSQHLHQVTTAHHIHHSDSNEWTEFTSAPFNVGQESSGGGAVSTTVASLVIEPPSTFSEVFPSSYSTPALGALTNCGGGGGQQLHHHQQQQQQGRGVGGADLSEFDPIAVSTAGGSSVSCELQQHGRAPFKNRT